jgi:hypothetical protein
MKALVPNAANAGDAVNVPEDSIDDETALSLEPALQALYDKYEAERLRLLDLYDVDENLAVGGDAAVEGTISALSVASHFRPRISMGPDSNFTYPATSKLNVVIARGLTAGRTYTFPETDRLHGERIKVVNKSTTQVVGVELGGGGGTRSVDPMSWVEFMWLGLSINAWEYIGEGELTF